MQEVNTLYVPVDVSIPTTQETGRQLWHKSPPNESQSTVPQRAPWLWPEAERYVCFLRAMIRPFLMPEILWKPHAARQRLLVPTTGQ